MKAFVTGGSGFIGRKIILRLLERGYQVTTLVRSPEKAADLAAIGADIVYGDVTEMASLRAGMRGCDVVFHTAGYVDTGDPDQELMETVNVDEKQR